MEIQDLQNIFSAWHRSGEERDYWEFLDGFGGKGDMLTEVFDLGVVARTFTKELHHRSTKKGKEERKFIADLSITSESGVVRNVGLSFPLFDGAGEMVDLFLYRLRGQMKDEERGSFLKREGMIWKTDEKEVVLCSSPFDVLVLWGHGFENAVFVADWESEDFAAKLEGLKSITLIGGEVRNLKEKDGLRVYQVDSSRFGERFWRYFHKLPTAKDELESLLMIAPLIQGEVEAVKGSQPILAKENGFYWVDMEGRVYRLGGLEQNRKTACLKVTLRVLAEDEKSHTDTLDLYQDKHRTRWTEKAADELGVNKAFLKKDLGIITLLAEEAVFAMTSPKAAPSFELTPKETEEAKAWLEDKDLFGNLAEDLKVLGLGGNEGLAGYLACCSRLTDTPLSITSPCSFWIEEVCLLVPEEKRVLQGSVSPKALFYLGDEALKESVFGLNGSAKVPEEVGALLRTGKIHALTVETDKEMNAKTTASRVVSASPVMILREQGLDEKTKGFCLNLREGLKALDVPLRSAEFILQRERVEEIRRKHRNIQRYLTRFALVNEFAEKLTISCPRAMSRELYLRLIDSVCLLRQCQKDLAHLENGVAVLKVGEEDIRIANGIAKDLFQRNELADLPSGLRESFGAFCEDLAKREKEDFSRSDYRCFVGCGMTTSKNHLDKLLAAELIFAKKEQGKAAVYRLGIEYPFDCVEVVLTSHEELAA